jgi:transcriptional regulator with XRE-family HTH domain
MDDVRLGRILRALRRRRGWTQHELGSRCGLSQQAISLIERGHGSQLSGATLRRVFAPLDARWEPTVTWRGGDLDRVLDEAHARLVDEVVRRLVALRWDVRVEVTYSEFASAAPSTSLRRDVTCWQS